MGRDGRFEEIRKHAVPDHRLFPQEMEKLDKRPRNQRRIEKKIVRKTLEVIYARWRSDHDSGAGYPIDQQLREYLHTYNDRALGHGLATMPSSFNVFEGFFEFQTYEHSFLFRIRPEKDHLFSLSDFLDFATSADRRSSAIRSVMELQDGIIYNFTAVGDIRDLAFLHADSKRFVIAGFTMIRRGEQLHWAMIGGPICDLAEETQKLRHDPARQSPEKSASPWKTYIEPPKQIEYRAEPLAGTDDVWKTIVFGIFNLGNEKHEIRAINIDQGNSYTVIMDDPSIYGVTDPARLSQQQRTRLAAQIERLEKDRLFFEIAETCFGLPAYFAYRVTLIRETKRPTAIGPRSKAARRNVSTATSDKRPLFKTVASLEVVDLGSPTVVRAYSPPRYKVEVDGFWRTIDPNVFGKDSSGNPIRGRTWVKGHLRWRDRPDRPSTIFIKRSIASARAKAAAIIASDPSAFVVRETLPPIFPIEVEPEDENAGWLYVMRCPLMEDDIYKVGWSSRPPKIRAEELSTATGVPLAYIVVESWKVDRARQIETTAHQNLAEFRINPRREFFKAPFEKIRAGIVNALGMTSTGPC
jgi:hypothetical protein